MPSKASTLDLLTCLRNMLNDRISYIQKLETGRLYKLQFYGERDVYGFIISFNKESFRVQVVASDVPCHKLVSGYPHIHDDRESFNFNTPISTVRESDLPLLVGMKFVNDHLLKDIISGKKRLKMG